MKLAQIVADAFVRQQVTNVEQIAGMLAIKRRHNLAA